MNPEIAKQAASMAQKAMEQQQQQPQTEGPGKAAEGDVEKFEQAMGNNDAGNVNNVNGVEQVQNAEQVSEVNNVAQAGQVNETQAPSTADKIFKEVSDLSNDMNAEQEGIINEVDSDSSPMSPEKLIKLQMKVANFTLKQSMVGKVGEKSNQGVQTLFKGQ